MKKFLKPISSGLLIISMFISVNSLGQYQMEDITRGMVAIQRSTNQVFTAWRKLLEDDDTLAFNVYRMTDGAAAIKINPSPLKKGTNFLDVSVNTSQANSYFVTALKSGGEEVVSDTVNVWSQKYKSIPITPPAGGTTPPYTVTNNHVTESYPDGQTYTYTANDCSVGDLDGDGEYEIILKWDPTNSRDNAHGGYTGNVFLDAYEVDGTRLWRIDLGVNIRAGAHYTQFMVYDLDGDGKAEVACKTAPGSKDATGSYLQLGPAATDDDAADYRNTEGRILTGPEYLTLFNGETGNEMFTTTYVPVRGSVGDWGDTYGNRVDRFLGAIAYLDGEKPSLVMCRGYYAKTSLAAWDWDGDTLTNRWTFIATSSQNSTYTGQGNHNLSVGDVDDDGKDEIIYGACSIDDDGTGLYSTGWGHGDAIHFSNLDPRRAGFEVAQPHEPYPNDAGLEFRDARTGDLIWGKASTDDVGRGMSADIDPRYVGCEVWASGGGLSHRLFTADGVELSSSVDISVNFGIWWDGDLQRELLDDVTVSDWNYTGMYQSSIMTASDCSSNNSTKKTPCLQADLYGDWREEVIFRKSDNTELRIYSTTDTTIYRINCLMQDHVYRMAVAWQNTAYNQPPHPGFYLGTEMYMHDSLIPPAKTLGLTALGNSISIRLNWKANTAPDLAGYNVYRSENSAGPFTKINTSLVDTFSYKDITVADSVLYYYAVSAVDSFGKESVKSDIASARNTVIPSIPEGFFARNGDSKAKLFWDQHDDEDVVGYNVYRSDVSGSGYVKVNTTLVTETDYLDSVLINNDKHYYVINCVNSNDRESQYTNEDSIIVGEITYSQAESGKLFNTYIGNVFTGFNGNGYVDFLATPGYVIFLNIFGSSGPYILTYRYSLGSLDRVGELVVNDDTTSLTMHKTASWDSFVYDSVNINLDAEFTNNIQFVNIGNDFGFLDEIIVKPGSFVPVSSSVVNSENILKITPNPFRYSTDISFKVLSDCDVTVKIYNYLGQEVNQIFNGRCNTGIKTMIWNGEDATGNKVSTGIYFCTVLVNNQKQFVGRIVFIE